ncbi:hypothetical protein K505DRAFT_322128 [Melanomma pulvis-pyrius CBS 109.77]|uniref:Vacuolar import and degradation protein-domain-containing protein n=1 Tax=Melanomma pulvis-pyrius CBS 109.77 TaxID=1314802 RepID=A0A6A6XQ84_9PLEO|nr:hypothetical protein K505DRAFT_322128 [Melanomma pulvis-pyrius CBS 109.77]
MPPANSRSASPPVVPAADPAGTAAAPGTPPSYLSALHELESPVNQDVLNLAATLTTQAEDDASEASLRYLRASQEHEEWRVERSRHRLHLLERHRDELSSLERLRRVMSRLSGINDPPAAYGDRVPSQNSLYDWSPATNEADDEDELDQILAELRREQPHTHHEILRVLGRSQLDTERERRMRASRSSPLPPSPSQADSALRSAVMLQSVRRHPRFSARTRDHMQRSADRDATARQLETRDRILGGQADLQRRATLERDRDRILNGQADIQRQERRLERDREVMARVDSYRRSYLDRPSGSAPPAISPLLEQTIKYLSRIRYASNIDDSLICALDAGFLSKEYFTPEQSADFLLDSSRLLPPAETSWLAPGAVLSGYQHATTVTSTTASATPGANTTLYRFRNNESLTSTLFEPPSRPWLSHTYNPPNRRSTLSSAAETATSHSHSPQQDRWPVKVTIHAVDYSKMSLSATMEAYNVPSHPHSHQSVLSSSIEGIHPPSRTSSITTYLEGEILDFNQHTLLTESFKSSALNDATYWRKLPPFQKYTDEELVKKLTSRKWFTEELNREWILMRWKERCFVKSLNRSTADPVQPPSSFSDLSVRPTTNESFHSTTSSRRNYPTSSSNHYWQQDGEHGASFDDSGCGLTISGFYYVCLKRSDGSLEGLYYDPQSSPYQCLKLESVRGGVFPAWGFR